ncbi:hypothetical protein [Escherichia coli]|uniref:hypothetical protein n=1 Tax=Escherichia coli TaxID=562 RepID=UPI003EC00A14
MPPYVDDNGQVRITITNGLVKTPVYGVPGAGGNSDVQGAISLKILMMKLLVSGIKTTYRERLM